jgi:hypothetical protein
MGRANPSELVSSEVALTSATMQKASIAQGTHELLSSVGGVVTRRLRTGYATL